VVDDMPSMRKLLIKVLNDLGFSDITEASDGSKAWEAIGNASPAFDLVFSDWNMPNCTGIDLLKRVRSDSRFSKTPFFMVTGEAENQQIAEAARSGVSQYIVKPFTQEVIAEKLKAVYLKISSV
jgi:two-component system chemotaxis response regulator CheY